MLNKFLIIFGSPEWSVVNLGSEGGCMLDGVFVRWRTVYDLVTMINSKRPRGTINERGSRQIGIEKYFKRYQRYTK